MSLVASELYHSGRLLPYGDEAVKISIRSSAALIAGLFHPCQISIPYRNSPRGPRSGAHKAIPRNASRLAPCRHSAAPHTCVQYRTVQYVQYMPFCGMSGPHRFRALFRHRRECIQFSIHSGFYLEGAGSSSSGSSGSLCPCSSSSTPCSGSSTISS